METRISPKGIEHRVEPEQRRSKRHVFSQRAIADIWNAPNPEKPGPIVFPEVARFTRICAYDRPGRLPLCFPGTRYAV